MDLDSAPFHEAVAQHRLTLQRCDACDRHRFPPMPTCPWCAADTFTWSKASGRGRVYSWVTVHRALSPDRVDDVPYTIATVTLDEGCRMFGRLVDHAPVSADDPVVAVFVDHVDHTEVRFQVVTP